MSSSITLKRTIDQTVRYIYNSPLLYVNSGELAYSIGDEVRQFILGPPFVWRWNRAYAAPITCQAGQSDYTVNLPNFGFLEKAWIAYPGIDTNTPTSDGIQITKELEVKENLAQGTVLGQPAYISVVEDDNNGNITFRLLMIPDQQYSLNLTYQQSAPSFGSVNDTWAPIPDYLSYLYFSGFRSFAFEYKGDERFAFARQEFMRLVVAASDGLTDTQKALFLGDKIANQRQLQGGAETGQMARNSRGGR